MPPESKDTFADRFETTVGARGSRNIEGQATVPAGLTDVAAIAAGEFHSLALEGDGTVVAWDRNSHGQVDVPGGLTDVLERRRWSSIARTRSGRDSLKNGAKR
jgi:hypothetical protein